MEETQKVEGKPRYKKREQKIFSIYSRSLITRKIVLPITAIGRNLKETIEESITFNYEGKCVVEGFIKPGSTKIITYSSGVITRGNLISFDVVFECQICFPVEGTIIVCVAKENTKAGIKAESVDEKPSPVIVFISRDHHYSMPYFSEIKEGDKINVRVLGQRFELNDTFISVIGELIKPRTEHAQTFNKPKLVFEN
jgi:DNA-directed RNA polymerase subunit E'/Rpb7